MWGEAYPSKEGSTIEDDSGPYGLNDDGSDNDDSFYFEPTIDFDLVYSSHNFAATVDGQATVVKGEHLVLLDDSNRYWSLVRVLRTQQIGYIPGEDIETPYERLARFNKRTNIDVRSPCLFSRILQ